MEDFVARYNDIFFFFPFDWFGLLKPWTLGRLLTDDEIEDNFAL